MAVAVREAREDDLDHIVTWSSNTFDWGDYVPRRFLRWLEDPSSAVLVAPDEADRPMALCHAVMLSPSEGWLEAARVHPGHRRRGLGTALNDAAVDWLAARGARIVRLAIEADNSTASSQVEKLAYRPVGSWHHCQLRVDPTHRCPSAYRLHPAPPTEADAAWMFWANGDLARAGRELMARGWQWSRTRPDHLSAAAAGGSLYQSPAGWVIAEQPQPGWLRTGWMATAPEDAPRLLEGLVDLGVDLGVEEVALMVPAAPWAIEALIRAGSEMKEVVVYAKVPQISRETP